LSCLYLKKMRHLYKWFLAVLASSWYSIPRACHNCRNEESRLMGLTSARTSGVERVQMPHACCWSSLPARVYRCVVSLLHAHVRPPSASPHPARTPRLHQPLLPLTPSSPCGRDPGARMRTNMLRPQDRMRAVVRPFPSARAMPS
jgi:hypothetical protein